MVVVTAISLVVMVVEVVAGWMTGSTALLADGIHMGTHVAALGLATAAYYLMRRHAEDRRLSLGSGKIGELSAFASALLLGASGAWIMVEACERLLDPHAIAYSDALVVATLGFIVNLGCALILGSGHHHHGSGEDHSPDDHCTSGTHDRDGHGHAKGHHGHHHDSNFKAAFIHVVADALTSLAAITAIAAAWAFGWNWLDPLVALAASAVIVSWSWNLLKSSGSVLLDLEAAGALRTHALEAIGEGAGLHVTDLHLWSVGSGLFTMTAQVVAHEELDPQDLRGRLRSLPIVHPVIEVRQCRCS